jgi:hypothetical protein
MAKAVRVLIGLGIFAPFQKMCPGLPMWSACSFCRQQARLFTFNKVPQCLATGAALLSLFIWGLYIKRAQYLAAAAGSLTSPISGEY